MTKRAAILSLIFLVSCRFDLPEVVIDAPPPDAPRCPAEYAPLPGGPAGHVYRTSPGGTWSEQFDFCKTTSPRAYLAVPNDATELTNLVRLAGSVLWVGIDDQVTEGVYISAETDGPATFLPWAADEPDGAASPTEDCVKYFSGAINDVVCSGFGLAACECDP